MLNNKFFYFIIFQNILYVKVCLNSQVLEDFLSCLLTEVEAVYGYNPWKLEAL